VYLIQVSSVHIGQQGLGHFFEYIGPCFPLAGGLSKFYANAGGKQNTIPASSQSTFINEQ
jgi:hypothetical protein